MALWRVLDYTSTRQTTHLNSDKKFNFKAERNGAFAAKPLGESPRNLLRFLLFHGVRI